MFNIGDAIVCTSRNYKKPYSSCKSMEVDSINEEYGPSKKAQIQYHLDKLKELTQ